MTTRTAHQITRFDAHVGAQSAVDVVRMRRRHLRSVLKIDPTGWSAGLFLGELARSEDRLYAVARARGSVVGFAGAMRVGEDAHVTTLAVDATWRGQRVGTRLMLVLASQAYAWGCENLTLEVRAGNAAAIALYRRFGLAPAGVRRNYYADLGEDALVMWGHEVNTRAFAERLARIEASIPGSTRAEGVPW